MTNSHSTAILGHIGSATTGASGLATATATTVDPTSHGIINEILLFLGQNSGALGVILTFIMGCITCTFYIKSYRLRKVELKEAAKKKLIEEYSEDISKLVEEQLREKFRKGDKELIITSQFDIKK